MSDRTTAGGQAQAASDFAASLAMLETRALFLGFDRAALLIGAAALDIQDSLDGFQSEGGPMSHLTEEQRRDLAKLIDGVWRSGAGVEGKPRSARFVSPPTP